MSVIREVLFSFLFNAIVQSGLFAVVAAALSPFVKKTQAKYQHTFYLGVLILCLATPLLNTSGRARPTVNTKNSTQEMPQQGESAAHNFWGWERHSGARIPIEFGSAMQSAVVMIWGLFVIYRCVHFGRGIHRVHRLREEASPLLPPAQSVISAWFNSASRQVALLESVTVDVPVTVGFFRPTIVLPRNLAPRLREGDLSAVIAHEFAHIHRRDFLVHILCEALTVPLFWHPGIRYLISKISQTRELACDDYAAVRLGKRYMYAQSLLRLASLCLHAPHAETIGLSIFADDNLEVRIMRLMEKRSRLSRVGLLGLIFAASITFGSSAMLAGATSLHADPGPPRRTQTFAGTWNWMFKGRCFATMILVTDGSDFRGSVTESRVALDDEGYLSMADPSENSTAVPITRAVMEGSALHVTVEGGFEFLVALKDDTHVEIRPVGAPANMKPIQAERAH